MPGLGKGGTRKEAPLVASPYASDGDLYLTDAEDDKQRSHRREAANRSMVVKTRVSLLFMISVAIVGTSVVTWHLSLTTTSDAFDDMSDVLRHEVITSSAAKVKDFIDSLTMGYASVFKCLDSLNDFSRASMSTGVMTCMWSTMTAAANARGTHVITHESLMSSYRRYGPEARMLNVSMVATVPAPPEDKESLMYIYVPDEVTGRPITDGKMVKACERGHCPAYIDPKVYIPPLPPLMTEFYSWRAAQTLANHEAVLGVSIGVAGSWLPVVYMVGAFRDHVSNDLVAILAVIYQATTIREHLESLRVVSEMGGVMFVTTGSALNILSATRGELIILPTPEVPYASFLKATDSNDPIVSRASRHMNDTYGSQLFVHFQESRIEIPGHGHYYVNSQPITHHGLTLLAFLAVPTDVFRGHIDDARRTSVRVTTFVVLGMFVGGVIGILASTTQLTNTFSIVANQNEMLRLKLRRKDREGDDGSWSNVDMGTASEKLHAMIRTLQAGRALTQQQVTQMQELINVDDMHKPQFLRTLQDHGNTEAIVDKETGSWLFSLINVGASSRSMFATKFRKQGQRHRVSRDGSESTSSTTDTRDMSTHQAVMGSKASEDEDDVSEHIIDVEALLAVGNQARGAPRVPEDLEAGESADVGGGGRGLGGGGGGSGGPVYFSTLLSSMVTLQDMSLEEEPVGAPAPDLAAGGALAQQLAKLGSWELDALKLADVSSGRPILFVGYTALHTCRLMHEFALPKDKLVRFLLALEQGMPPHAMYHSAAHIADVAGSLYHLLRESGVSQHLRRIDELAAMCAALMHDYKHPGVNNDYIQRTGGELSYRYNDVSILENYHLSEAFNLLRDDKCHFLKHLGTTEFADIRHSIIEMVLATDLKRHFALLDAFKSRLLNLQDKPWDKDSETDRLLLLRMAIKIADLGHACKPLAMHKVWTGLIVEEFYVQGDLERSAQMPISPFMDRNNNNVPKAQHGFIHFLVFPLVEAWVKAFPKSAPLLANLIENFEFWKNEQMNEITRSPRSR
eukprot:jgi/Mesvir1/29048/Mv18357-RA.1